MGYGSFTYSRAHKKVRSVTGYTLNSVNWANVDTGLDIALPAATGDTVVVELSCLVGTESPEAYFDVVTVVSGSPVNSIAKEGTVETTFTTIKGLSAWWCLGSTYKGVGGGKGYTLVATDIADDEVLLRLRYATSTATNRTLYGSPHPLDFMAWVIGPPRGG